MAGNEGSKYAPEQIRFFEKEREKQIKNWKTKGATFLDPESKVRLGKKTPVLTDRQHHLAHTEMMREKRAEEKIIDRLKTAQPGDPRFESFIHLNALMHEPFYFQFLWHNSREINDSPIY